MGAYKETYRDLCHGTDAVSAEAIREEGFVMSSAEGHWCGEGVYFYDIKSKAWWSADRTCRRIEKSTGERIKPDVIFADIVELDREFVFDLRSTSDMMDFKACVDEITQNKSIVIEGLSDFDRTVELRAMLISFYAQRNGKKLVIGLFRQRCSETRVVGESFANNLFLIIGAETIYCVKDCSIIQNIR